MISWDADSSTRDNGFKICATMDNACATSAGLQPISGNPCECDGKVACQTGEYCLAASPQTPRCLKAPLLHTDLAYGGCKRCRVYVWDRSLRGHCVLRRGEQHLLQHARGFLDRDVLVRVHWCHRSLLSEHRVWNPELLRGQ